MTTKKMLLELPAHLPADHAERASIEYERQTKIIGGLTEANLWAYAQAQEISATMSNILTGAALLRLKKISKHGDFMQAAARYGFGRKTVFRLMEIAKAFKLHTRVQFAVAHSLSHRQMLAMASNMYDTDWQELEAGDHVRGRKLTQIVQMGGEQLNLFFKSTADPDLNKAARTISRLKGDIKQRDLTIRHMEKELIAAKGTPHHAQDTAALVKKALDSLRFVEHAMEAFGSAVDKINLWDTTGRRLRGRRDADLLQTRIDASAAVADELAERKKKLHAMMRDWSNTLEASAAIGNDIEDMRIANARKLREEQGVVEVSNTGKGNSNA